MFIFNRLFLLKSSRNRIEPRNAPVTKTNPPQSVFRPSMSQAVHRITQQTTRQQKDPIFNTPTLTGISKGRLSNRQIFKDLKAVQIIQLQMDLTVTSSYRGGPVLCRLIHKRLRLDTLNRLLIQCIIAL